MTRFLLDEHVSRAYATQLRRRDASLYIERVGDRGVPPKGTPDADLLVYCEEHELLLITNNRASMPVHLAEHLETGRHMPGILVIPSKEVVSAVIEDLLLMVVAGLPDDTKDCIEYLPL
jgi:hypothetical protein